MEILPYGDHAILVNFENKIDKAINKKVIDLNNHLIDNKLLGLLPLIWTGGVHDISALKFHGSPIVALNLPNAGDLFKSSALKPPKPIFCWSLVRCGIEFSSAEIAISLKLEA